MVLSHYWFSNRRGQHFFDIFLYIQNFSAWFRGYLHVSRYFGQAVQKLPWRRNEKVMEICPDAANVHDAETKKSWQNVLKPQMSMTPKRKSHGNMPWNCKCPWRYSKKVMEICPVAANVHDAAAALSGPQILFPAYFINTTFLHEVYRLISSKFVYIWFFTWILFDVFQQNERVVLFYMNN